MTTLWGELKRRNVARVGIAYVIVGWLILQLADVLGGLLELPGWTGKLVVFLLVIGFPIALVLAWAFELTPDGVKRERDVDRAESVTQKTGRKLDRAIIGLLCAALVFVVIDNYVLEDAAEEPATETTDELPANEPQSIAVLPFVNMSSDKEQEYFADGLSEEILNLLARIPDLKVIGRTSSFSFKGKNEDLRVIGETLGAGTILEGSVRKSGERIRITAQLIDTGDGSHLWSDTYDRTIEDVFAVQDEVAAAIIEALHVHVGSMPTRGVPTQNTQAYNQYLQARAAANAYNFPRAEILLKQAIALDPNFVDAWEVLGYTYWWLSGSTMDALEGYALMREAAGRVLDLQPDSVMAKALFESGNVDDYSFLRELEALERVVATKPNETLIYDGLIYTLLQAGYFGEGLEYARQYVELDPLAASAHIRLSEALVANGLRDKALESITTAAQLGSMMAIGSRSALLAELGRIDEAVQPTETFWSMYGASDVSWIPELLANARDPLTGAAYLDKRIPEIVATFPEDARYGANRGLMNQYLLNRHIDRYYEIILSPEEIEEGLWNVDTQIYAGTVTRDSGFTAHERFEELAEINGLFEVWDVRGAPDMCEKIDGKWACR